MKMVVIAYAEGLEGELMALLKANSVGSYTKWTKVLGKGQKSGPHLLTHVWPKGNNVIMISIEDERAEKLLEAVGRLRETLGHEGVKAFLIPLEAVT